MSPRHHLFDAQEVVGLTIYMRLDVAEVSRILQMLVRERLTIDRFNANFSQIDLSHVAGLNHVDVPLMKLVVVASVASTHEIESATKALNRLLDVVKVLVSQSI